MEGETAGRTRRGTLVSPQNRMSCPAILPPYPSVRLRPVILRTALSDGLPYQPFPESDLNPRRGPPGNGLELF